MTSGKDEPFAVISDIHSNLEALNAVLGNLAEARISRIICLGDIVGYGADFEACVDLLAEKCEFVLRGNHDDAVINGPVDFNPVARDVINYTRRAMKPLKPRWFSSSRKRFRWSFLEHLEKEHRIDQYVFYHGSPRDPVKEYVMRTDVVFAPEKLRDIFTYFEGICFIGHTHQPGVIIEEMNLHFHEPSRLDFKYETDNRKAIVNVGSVGQPRDSDNRASFVVVSNKVVHFHRVAYDYEKAMTKIKNNPDIHDNCATRLARGK